MLLKDKIAKWSLILRSKAKRKALKRQNYETENKKYEIKYPNYEIKSVVNEIIR